MNKNDLLGVITQLPEDGKKGKVQPDDPKRGWVSLTADTVATAPPECDLKLHAKVGFDIVIQGGFQFAVNLRPPSAYAAEPKPATPATSPPPSTPDAGKSPKDREASPPKSETRPVGTDAPQPPSPDRHREHSDSQPAVAPTAGKSSPASQSRPQTEARPCDQHQPPARHPGANANTPLPYRFIAVPGESQLADTERRLATMVTHDGVNAGGHHSGELRLELRALTPLLVGQHRYPWQALQHENGDPLLKGAFASAKKILEPQLIRITGESPATISAGRSLSDEQLRESRVLIPATSLKGALRHAIAAILDAPMERVGERRMSYRPNIDTSNLKERTGLKCFAAVVTQIDDAGRSLHVRRVSEINQVLFVERPRTRAQLQAATDLLKTKRIARPQPRRAGRHAEGLRPEIRFEQNVLSAGTRLTGYDRPLVPGRNFPTNRLEHGAGNWSDHIDYQVCHYACGIDGNFEMAGLARDLHQRRSAMGEDEGEAVTARHYVRALVPTRALQGRELIIEAPLLDQHTATLREIADTDVGHLSRLPDSFWGEHLSPAEVNDRRRAMAAKIMANRPQQFQLIYLEARVDDQGEPIEVVSFGTHFRYRWRYTSSVRHVHIDPKTGAGNVRVELDRLPGEHIEADADGRAAGKLSGARLLFGYVADADTATDGIGAESFARIAGRIGLNHALEQVDPAAEDPEQRFLWFKDTPSDARFLIPLRILGMPKPTAVEHYISQDRLAEAPGATITYGDLPGDDGGDLNGRKLYVHQPNAAAQGALRGDEPFLAEDETVCRSDQATLGRLISRPDSRFRATLRFRDLRPWEIGALLIALEPNLLGNIDIHERLAQVVKRVVRRRQPNESQPQFATKLGYGRPLGLGSVAVKIARARLVGQDATLTEPKVIADWKANMILACLDHLRGRESRLIAWLEANRYGGQPRADYPRNRDGVIYAWHSELRAIHAKHRRYRPGAAPEVEWPGRERPGARLKRN